MAVKTQTQKSQMSFSSCIRKMRLCKRYSVRKRHFTSSLSKAKKPETVVEDEPYVPPANPDAQGIKTFPYFQDTCDKVSKVIVGLSNDGVKAGIDAVMECYDSLVGVLDMEAHDLERWDKRHAADLKNACSLVKVDVTFNYAMGRLNLKGFKENLGKVAYHRIISEAESEVHAAYQAQLVQKQVQWSYVEVAEDGEHLIPYSLMNNYWIETAYQEGKEKVGHTNEDREAYIIDFAKMEEIPEDPNADDSECVKVIRKNKIAGLNVGPPKEWAPMGNNDMDVIGVQSSTAEYTTIQDKFIRSLNSTSAKVVKIERVQNLTLYKQYAMMKQQMEKTMSSTNKLCEKSDLWHGTKEEAVDGIMKYGFNRSYSDLSKSAYGQGVYFASTAEYSSRNEYAVISSLTKQRNMFLCKVLVGEYTVGTKDMRTPPEMPSSHGKRYHSTVDDDKAPSIFVTYSDVQAYPEYRIVFTDS